MKIPLITFALLAACACAPSHETKAAAPAAKSTTMQPQPPTTLPQVGTPAAQTAAAEADRVLEQRVRQAIASDAALADAFAAITMTAKGGTVTVSGTVASRDEKDALVSKIKSMPGVVACDDQLEVKM